MNNYQFKVFEIQIENGVEWGAECVEVPNIVGGGESPNEAVEEAKENLEVYFDFLRSQNKPIPSPSKSEEDNYSGKLLLRMAKTLHYKLDQLSSKEGVSLNSLITGILHSYVGAQDMKVVYTKEVKEAVDSIDIGHKMFDADKGLYSYNLQYSSSNVSSKNPTLTFGKGGNTNVYS